MEITPKAMEIEYVRIKRLNQEREKAYAIELDAIGWHFIPMAGYYFSSLDSRKSLDIPTKYRLSPKNTYL